MISIDRDVHDGVIDLFRIGSCRCPDVAAMDRLKLLIYRPISLQVGLSRYTFHAAPSQICKFEVESPDQVIVAAPSIDPADFGFLGVRRHGRKCPLDRTRDELLGSALGYPMEFTRPNL
jgi:hypothetical protein